MVHQMEWMAHQARHIVKDPSKCVKDIHCGAEAVYQSAVSVAIFFEGLLPARSWSSWRRASGEFDRSSAAAKGFLERPIPVSLV
jgi:hypothetical protein